MSFAAPWQSPAYCTALLKQRTLIGPVGSNPTGAAKLIGDTEYGYVAEPGLLRCLGKAVDPSNGPTGSNPVVSANGKVTDWDCGGLQNRWETGVGSIPTLTSNI